MARARAGEPAHRLLARALLVLYVGWIASATLFPIPLRGVPGLRIAHPLDGAANLVPLRVIRETVALGWSWQSIRLLAGNVVLFVPFGVLVPSVWPSLATWKRMAIAALAFSLGIEVAQYAGSLSLGFAYRSTDIDDVFSTLRACCWASSSGGPCAAARP